MPSRPVTTLPRRALAVLVAATLGGALAMAGPSQSGASTAQTEGVISLDLVPVAMLDTPIAMASVPGNDDLIVAERGGKVRLLQVSGETITTGPTLVDISGFIETEGEGGLLGVTVNPAGDRLYLFHTNVRSNLRVAEYQLANAATTPTIVPGTRRQVIGIRHQPFENHNGGDITFGPDGRLYIAVGDGGGGGDPDRNGQDRTALLGKVLRINPTATATGPYKIPITNPFVGQAPRRGEIWLYGVRNPWRLSFDSETGDLYVADVGQSAWEEINVLPSDNGAVGTAGRGVNLGWSRMEGTDTFHGPEPANHTPPTFQYPHVGSNCSGSITGGYVYRGSDIPSLTGHYVYGDFCKGDIASITAVDGALTGQVTDLGIDVNDFSLISFGQGADGELYVLQGSGAVSRIEQAGT